MKKPNIHFLLILVIGIGAILRFYNLDWGAPYYFHPDERNIASSISQLHFPDQLNPNFFAYGSIPIYWVYLIGVLLNYATSLYTSIPDLFAVSFEHAIIIGRMFSALLSLGTVFILYKVARMFVSRKFSLLAVILGVFSVGMIQYSHFGTFEMYLTFFSLVLLYNLLRYQKSRTFKFFIYAVITVGILSAIKISSIVLLPLPLLIAFAINSKRRAHSRKISGKFLFQMSVYTCVCLLVVAGVFLLGNPFAIIDFKAFYGSMRYESSVATGSLPVFYTGTFHGTVPLLFQALYVLPFLLNPIVWFVLLPALVILLLKQVKSDQQEYRIVLIFIIFLFLPQAVLYVKWTRYMVPLLPVLYLILVIALASLHRYLKKYSFLKNLVPAVCITLVIASIIWSFSFVKTVYFDPDTRVQAAEIISLQEKPTQRVLSEVYDMGIVPFDTAFSTISLFNFYDLENDPDIRSNLPTALSHNDLLILPSQRIIKSRIMNEDIFPYGHNFYQSVLTSSRYSQIYQTPCDIWCMLVYLGDPVYGVEDTANVFDRPTIHIYSIE